MVIFSAIFGKFQDRFLVKVMKLFSQLRNGYNHHYNFLHPKITVTAASPVFDALNRTYRNICKQSVINFCKKKKSKSAQNFMNVWRMCADEIQPSLQVGITFNEKRRMQLSSGINMKHLL